MIVLEKEKKNSRQTVDAALKKGVKEVASGVRRLSTPAIVAITLTVVFFAAFFGYHGYMLVKSTEIKTEIAFPDTVETNLNVKMFVVRDEQIVTKTTGANVVSAVKDGTRVAVNDTVAYLFSDSASAGNLIRMNEINELLAYYEGLDKESSHVVSDTSLLDEKIMDVLGSFSAMVSSGDFSELEDGQQELRDTITSKQTATGMEIDVTATMQELRKEYSQLSATTSSYEEIKSSGTGYYISGTDGCETVLAYDNVDEWTVEDVENALEQEPQEGDGSRLVHGYYWYMVCLVDKENINLVKEGSYYTVSFPDSAVDDIRAEVYSLEYDEDVQKAVVILRCLTMNEELAGLRCENAQIVVKEYSGFRVRNEAIRANEDNELGVYIVRGAKMLFRKVNVLYTAEDYCIVQNPEDNEELEGQYISRYDEYIVEGRDLAHGKLIEK